MVETVKDYLIFTFNHICYISHQVLSASLNTEQKQSVYALCVHFTAPVQISVSPDFRLVWSLVRHTWSCRSMRAPRVASLGLKRRSPLTQTSTTCWGKWRCKTHFLKNRHHELRDKVTVLPLHSSSLVFYVLNGTVALGFSLAKIFLTGFHVAGVIRRAWTKRGTHAPGCSEAWRTNEVVIVSALQQAKWF